MHRQPAAAVVLPGAGTMVNANRVLDSYFGKYGIGDQVILKHGSWSQDGSVFRPICTVHAFHESFGIQAVVTYQGLDGQLCYHKYSAGDFRLAEPGEQSLFVPANEASEWWKNRVNV